MKHIISLEEMLKRVKNKWGNAIIYISGYKGISIKCMWKCSKDGHIWFASPNSILNGRGCPICGLHKRALSRTTPLEKMLEQVKEVWGNLIEYIGGYTKKHSKCWWRCTLDDTVWKARPHDILCGHGCPVCGQKIIILKKTISLDEILKRVKEVWGDLIEYISGYINTNLRCKWKCKTCNHIWEATPKNIINRHGCPVCVKDSMERPVRDVLKKKRINFNNDKPLKNCVYDKRPLRPDFYIETRQGILWIECDGRTHFNPDYGENEFKEQKARDKFKNEYCKVHSICLIRVTSNTKWGTEKHITLQKILELIEIGIDSETREIDFELFRQYDFNKT